MTALFKNGFVSLCAWICKTAVTGSRLIGVLFASKLAEACSDRTKHDGFEAHPMLPTNEPGMMTKVNNTLFSRLIV